MIYNNNNKEKEEKGGWDCESGSNDDTYNHLHQQICDFIIVRSLSGPVQSNICRV